MAHKHGGKGAYPPTQAHPGRTTGGKVIPPLKKVVKKGK